mgnify:CR=1 FL=1
MDWYTLDEENKKDGHYRRKPAEISALEIEFENAVVAFNEASDQHEANPTEESQNNVAFKLNAMLSLDKKLREARRKYHAQK